MKRGQGLSMNVIIIAALALLVLVVLAVVFIDRVGNVIEETEEEKFCKSTLQGDCVYADLYETGCPSDETKVGTCGVDDTGREKFCCK